MGRDKYKKEYTRIGVYSFVVLFEIVFEIVGYFLHEMNAAFAYYVVLGAWVDEIVDWNIVGNTHIEEIEGMLIKHYIVDETLTNKELAFEICGFVH